MTDATPDSDCLFCKLAAGEVAADRVYEDAALIAFRDVNPQAPVHLLVIPRTHVATVNDLETSQAELVGRMVLVARDLAAAEGLAENGYRLLLNCNRDGGQSVFHIHLHLLGGRALRWPPG